MLKPTELRAHLERAVPTLRSNPDQLSLMVRSGHLRCTGTGALSFEYAYTLNLVVLDYPGHADAITVPILAWLAVNQPELLDNPDLRDRAIRFEAELLNNNTVDLSIELDLTERVLVRPRAEQAGAYDIRHLSEPGHPAWPQQSESWQLYLLGELVAQWTHDPRPIL